MASGEALKETLILVNGKIVRQTVMGFTLGRMETVMKENGRHVYGTEMDQISLATVINSLANIVMGIQTASVNINGAMITLTLVNSRMG